jgi:hypothetical protein
VRKRGNRRDPNELNAGAAASDTDSALEDSGSEDSGTEADTGSDDGEGQDEGRPKRKGGSVICAYCAVTCLYVCLPVYAYLQTLTVLKSEQIVTIIQVSEKKIPKKNVSKWLAGKNIRK